MKNTFIYFLFSFLLFIIGLKVYNNNSESSNEKDKIEEIIELNDSDFDSFIKNGINNRWLIFFYLETCYHCYRARSVLNRILELREYKKINNIKFASVEVEKNPKCNDRFNSSQVPHIILIENNTMIEFDLYVNEKNLINFIETNFTNSSDVKPFPKYSFFKFYYNSFKDSVNYVSEEINKYLDSKNIKFKFSPLTLLASYIIFCFILWTIVILIVMKYFRNKKNKLKKDRILSDNNNENIRASFNLEENKKHFDNKDINNEENSDENKKFIKEDKIKEKTEKKAKEINEIDKNNIKDIKNEEKKKKD